MFVYNFDGSIKSLKTYDLKGCLRGSIGTLLEDKSSNFTSQQISDAENLRQYALKLYAKYNKK
ncbi:hypothetical protein [Candidatus Phytoplasma meliae]|uniref:Uncharacterized protein n=1 Tax=Candidatus Phytoplasma meliae TaxID=1848402 RepID=A0ABS5CYB0_9MOLU|nr:hypothetical protein [Candidatus Phytoplasma meliae]MBP5835956.1 hypothetical protein [Candidatus Phytoplasma meliae]